MGRIHVFNHISLDGFFAGPNGELDWFYNLPFDEGWYNYTHSQAGTSNTLIFGRITYEMMKSFWPTKEALEHDPGMANSVNKSPKILFSKSLKVNEKSSVVSDSSQVWKDAAIYDEIIPDEIIKIKKEKDMTILGSGSVIQQLAELDLIDEYFLAEVPVILGKGKSFFQNVNKKNLKLNEARSFKNGIVLLHYTTKM